MANKKVKITTEEWDTITERFRNYFNLSYNSELARLLGITKEGLQQFRPRGGLPYDKLINLALKHGASLNWLFTGMGEMGSDPELQEENEKLRIDIVRKDAVIEFLKSQLSITKKD